MPRAPTAARQRHVEPLVADDERSRRIEAEVGDRAIDQAAARLAAVAGAAHTAATVPSGWCGQ